MVKSFSSSLKNDTIKTVEGLDQQIQEQEKLRQNARIILSIIQRAKVQLIELRPTMNDEADQKLRVRSPSSPIHPIFSLSLF